MQPRTTEFGALLRSLRERQGASQSKLAEKAEFDHSYVSRLESGARMPAREAVNRLAEALNLERPQIDALLASAGFLPRDVTSLLSNEPVIGEILDLLQDEAVPREYRESVRGILRLLTQQARFAVGAARLSPAANQPHSNGHDALAQPMTTSRPQA